MWLYAKRYIQAISPEFMQVEHANNAIVELPIKQSKRQHIHYTIAETFDVSIMNTIRMASIILMYNIYMH